LVRLRPHHGADCAGTGGTGRREPVRRLLRDVVGPAAAAISFVFVLRLVRETKGKELEEM
jgi:hypothetical protein